MLRLFRLVHLSSVRWASWSRDEWKAQLIESGIRSLTKDCEDLGLGAEARALLDPDGGIWVS